MRHLRNNSRHYTFIWNNASKQDWKKIERVFIAAFMDAYRNIPAPHLKTPESVIHSWDQAYEKHYPTGNANEFIAEVLKPIQNYFSLSHNPASDECDLIRKHFADHSSADEFENAKTKIFALINRSAYLKEYFEDEYRKIMAEKPAKKIHYLVTYFEDQPIAFFTAEHNWKTGRAYLRLATVLPQFYRQGIGKFVMDEVCRYFDTNGRIELIARTLNLDAIAFYRAYGLREINQFDFNEPHSSVGLKSMIRSYFDKPEILRPPADEAVSDPSQFIGFRF